MEKKDYLITQKLIIIPQEQLLLEISPLRPMQMSSRKILEKKVRLKLEHQKQLLKYTIQLGIQLQLIKI